MAMRPQTASGEIGDRTNSRLLAIWRGSFLSGRFGRRLRQVRDGNNQPKERVMPATKLKAYLDEQRVKYVSIRHSPAFSAQEVAASAHVAGRDFAKTVVVKLDGETAMVVVPANRRLLLHDLREMLDSATVRLASENEFKALFSDCETGAMPPFGNLYGMKVFVDVELSHQHEIAFNAGSHTEIIKMAYADFDRLVRPLSVAAVTV
jgi:Ala-tRNA(Pro) deacylase